MSNSGIICYSVIFHGQGGNLVTTIRINKKFFYIQRLFSLRLFYSRQFQKKLYFFLHERMKGWIIVKFQFIIAVSNTVWLEFVKVTAKKHFQLHYSFSSCIKF